MSVLDELQRLTDRAGDVPPRSGHEVFTDARRRRTRRRTATGVTGAAVVALALVVAWPGTVPGSITIDDEVADTPDGGEEAAPEVPTLDLPDGWQQVQVGDAVFGVPGDREVVQLGAGEHECANADEDPRAYLAPAGGPAVGDCPAVGHLFPSIVAMPAEGAPEYDCECREGDVRTDAGVEGTLLEFLGIGGEDVDAGDAELVPTGARSYTFPEVDLRLEFRALDLDPGLDEAIVATIRPIGTSADAVGPGDPTTGTGEGGVGVQLPEGAGEWLLVEGTRAGDPLELRDELAVTLSLGGTPPDPDGAGAETYRHWGGGQDACAPYEVLFRSGPTGVLEVVIGRGTADLDACPDAATAEQRTRYLGALGAVTASAVEGDQLVLTGPDTRLVFDPLPAPGSATVTGSNDGAPVTVEVGGARLVLPADPAGQIRETGGLAPVGVCGHTGDGPVVEVFDAMVPDGSSCAPVELVAPHVVAAPMSRVPPAALPGHADVDGSRDVEEVEIGGTVGAVERFELRDGTPVTTYAAPDLDLYLDVYGQELDRAWVDALLAAIEPA